MSAMTPDDLAQFASFHRRLPHDDGIPKSACNVCRLLATLDERSHIGRDALAGAIRGLAHGRCCWDPEQDAEDIIAALSGTHWSAT